MKSPFPGMDPYIEASGLWEDFHPHLIEKIYEALADAVPERYTVRTGERSFIVLEGGAGEKSFFFQPDVKVAGSSAAESSDGGGTALAEPTTGSPPVNMRAFIEGEYRETFVEIWEAEREKKLVTSIEVLSPTNKRKGSPGWDVYLRKRQALLMGTANLVEIDLLRGGQRMPMLDPWPTSPFTLLVSRKQLAPDCRVWPAHYRHPLPIIPVPLLKPDADIPLDLQPMIEIIYARSRYHRSIDYLKPLVAPLASADESWLKQQLQSFGNGK